MRTLMRKAAERGGVHPAIVDAISVTYAQKSYNARSQDLSLLFWASEESGDPRYAEIVARHAETSLHYLLRPDGSCAHIARFDSETGSFLATLGGQGFGEGSAWSRGQGWAVYGFALAYRHTGRIEFLDASKRSAHYQLDMVFIMFTIPIPQIHIQKRALIRQIAVGRNNRIVFRIL